MNIKKILIDKIKKNGSLKVAEFIEICQFENDGYYLKNNPIGRDNDFITSPEISQMFGEVLGIFLINYWENKIKNNSRRRWAPRGSLGIPRPLNGNNLFSWTPNDSSPIVFFIKILFKR